MVKKNERIFMKIKKIVVKNLFKIFHHEIPLNMEDHITIIHGPNGFGKTVLLTMLNALFSSHYHLLRRIPFSELSVDFDDKSHLCLKKNYNLGVEKGNRGDGSNELIFEFSKQRTKPKSYTVKSIKVNEISFPLRVIDREVQGLERIDHETWIYFPTQERLTIEDVLERFGDRLPIPRTREKEEPSWLKEIKNSIHIRFIETQRLLRFSYPQRQREYEGRPLMVPTVINYSEELANAIQGKLAEYATLSQSLDRTFPTRLVKGGIASELTIDALRTKLSELEEKRLRLMTAGLLDKEKEIDFQELQKIDESNRNVLSVYVEDVKQKLSVFDELTNKIDLLVTIANRKFLYKKMSISKKEGFIFKTLDEQSLSPTSLSSGEQHELVLLYELLFKVNPDSLILIDEPELSLHVVWQQQFLKDLQEITKLAGFDVLIATHSPQIIHDRWDLTVELTGPKNEELSNCS